MAEVHPEAGEVRALLLHYKRIFDSDRIVRAETRTRARRGLRVRRSREPDAGRPQRREPAGGGRPAADPRAEEYEYLAARPFDPLALPPGTGADPYDPRRDHQLAAIVDPNGNRREFVYYTDAEEPLPGETERGLPADAGTGFFTEKWELVKRVLEYTTPSTPLRTEFSYDAREALSGRWSTTVRDGRGQDTVYVLDGNGSPLEIQEPLGRTTAMTWAADDVLKLQETGRGATLPAGRVTDYGYDTRGNLDVGTDHRPPTSASWRPRTRTTRASTS